MVKRIVTFKEGKLCTTFMSKLGKNQPKPSGTCEDAAFFMSEEVF